MCVMDFVEACQPHVRVTGISHREREGSVLRDETLSSELALERRSCLCIQCKHHEASQAWFVFDFLQKLCQYQHLRILARFV